MTEPNLGDELLKATGVATVPAEVQVANILARGQRRLRRLTWLVGCLWALMIPTLGMLLVFVWVEGTFTDAARYQYDRELHESKPNYRERKPEEIAIARALMIQSQTITAIGLATAAMIILGLLALGTILLVHSSRKATLRQVAVSLQTLCEQIQRLHPR